MCMATDGIKLMPCCRCVSRLEIRQELSQSRQRYGIGPSSCQPPQLSKHMGQAAPDGSFKAKHHEACRRINNILEVTAWLVVQLNPQIMCWHFKIPLGHCCYLRQKSSVHFHIREATTDEMSYWDDVDVTKCKQGNSQGFGNTETFYRTWCMRPVASNV